MWAGLEGSPASLIGDLGLAPGRGAVVMSVIPFPADQEEEQREENKHDDPLLTLQDYWMLDASHKHLVSFSPRQLTRLILKPNRASELDGGHFGSGSGE